MIRGICVQFGLLFGREVVEQKFNRWKEVRFIRFFRVSLTLSFYLLDLVKDIKLLFEFKEWYN